MRTKLFVKTRAVCWVYYFVWFCTLTCTEVSLKPCLWVSEWMYVMYLFFLKRKLFKCQFLPEYCWSKTTKKKQHKEIWNLLSFFKDFFSTFYSRRRREVLQSNFFFPWPVSPYCPVKSIPPISMKFFIVQSIFLTLLKGSFKMYALYN